jgi:hypothetical protein
MAGLQLYPLWLCRLVHSTVDLDYYCDLESECLCFLFVSAAYTPGTLHCRHCPRLSKWLWGSARGKALSDHTKVCHVICLGAFNNRRSGNTAIFVDQPIDPFFTRLAYTTFLRVCTRARPVALLASLLLNRLQGKKYVLQICLHRYPHGCCNHSELAQGQQLRGCPGNTRKALCKLPTEA